MFNVKKMLERDMQKRVGSIGVTLDMVKTCFSYLKTKHIFGKMLLYLLFNLVEVYITLKHLF